MNPNLTESREKSLLHAAAIGPALWRYRLPELGQAGIDLRSYLTSGDFFQEFKDGKNINIFSKGPERFKIFNTFAKELALANHRPYYTSLQTMNLILQENYKTERLYDSDILCVSEFYDSDFPERPFNYEVMWRLHEVMENRLDLKRPIYFCSDTAIEDTTWWTKKLRIKITENVREIYVGKANSRREIIIGAKKNRIDERTD